MNRLIFILTSLTFCTAVFSQNIEIAGSVVSTAGDYSTSASGKLSWTVGEPAADILTTANYTLTVGFQQNWDNIVAVEDMENNWQVEAYPNPVTDKIFIRFTDKRSFEILIELINVTGAKVFSEKTENMVEDDLISIDVSSLKRGLYLLHIISPGLKTEKVYKVIKQ